MTPTLGRVVIGEGECVGDGSEGDTTEKPTPKKLDKLKANNRGQGYRDRQAKQGTKRAPNYQAR